MYTYPKESILDSIKKAKSSLDYRISYFVLKYFPKKPIFSFGLIQIFFLIIIPICLMFSYGLMPFMVAIAYVIILILNLILFIGINDGVNIILELESTNEKLKEKCYTKDTFYKAIHHEMENHGKYYFIIQKLTDNFTNFENLDDFFIKIYKNKTYCFDDNFYINNFSKSKKMFKHFLDNVSISLSSRFDLDKDYMRKEMFDACGTLLDKKTKG